MVGLPDADQRTEKKEGSCDVDVSASSIVGEVDITHTVGHQDTAHVVMDELQSPFNRIRDAG